MMTRMTDFLRSTLKIGMLSLFFAICVIAGALMLCLAIVWDLSDRLLSPRSNSWASSAKSTLKYSKSS